MEVEKVSWAHFGGWWVRLPRWRLLVARWGFGHQGACFVEWNTGTKEEPHALDRGGIAFRGRATGRRAEVREERSSSRGQGRGDALPSHLSVLKLATLALRTLRVVELRSSKPVASQTPVPWAVVPTGTSHSPSDPPLMAVSCGKPWTGTCVRTQVCVMGVRVRLRLSELF